MIVKKDNWHYKLVQNQEFVSSPKEDNHDAISYIAEVCQIAFFRYLLIPLLLIIPFFLSENFLRKHPIMCIAFLLVLSTPLWSMLLLIAIEPFTKKTWRKLGISN